MPDVTSMTELLKAVSAVVSSVTVAGLLLAGIIYQTKRLEVTTGYLLAVLQDRYLWAEGRTDLKDKGPVIVVASRYPPKDTTPPV